MENNEVVSTPAAARPCLSFPLGLSLLLVLLFCMSGFLCCCLHWNKIRSLFPGFKDDDTDTDTIADSDQMNINQLHQIKPASLHMISKENQPKSLLVLMPGDRIPKFVAMKCLPFEKTTSKGSDLDTSQVLIDGNGQLKLQLVIHIVNKVI
ncbi:hypothetical protein QYF36_024584 [Acer negundo]|nr:hypothetical protein QYF36_024584 [Acer negundo]